MVDNDVAVAFLSCVSEFILPSYRSLLYVNTHIFAELLVSGA